MPQALNISLDTLNISALFPMLMAVLGAISILVIDLFKKTYDKSLYLSLALVFLGLDLAVLISYKGEEKALFDLLYLDGFSLLSQIIILVASIFFIFLHFSKLRFQDTRYAEYFAFYLFMVLGFQFMVSSNSLILIFLGLETSSLALVVMIAMYNKTETIESSIKYFTMGALSAGFFVFSCMIIYALTGTLDLGEISQVLAEQNMLSMDNFSNYILVLVAFIFMFASFSFKLSLFPFHTWVPDVYESSSSALAGYISVIPKMAGFVVALRFFEVFTNDENNIIYMILYLSVILTMTIPNFIALAQNDIKRMLAYSSISNAGMAMAAVLIGTQETINALFLYWILFAASNFGIFGMLWIMKGKQKEDYTSAFTYDKFLGLAQISPISAILLGLFLFTLTGLPPFALFWGKMYLISSAIEAEELILALFIIFNSVVSAYYYLKPIAYMFLKDPENKEIEYKENSSKALKVVLSLVAIFTILSIFYVEGILEFIRSVLG